jgi:DNA mismatch endonuclease (patch repair protein)
MTADVFPAEKRSWIMGRVKGRNTAPERLVRSILHRMGYRFRLHRADLPGKPDIVLPRHRVAVFVHGCFWHVHTCKRSSVPATNSKFWAEKLARNAERDRRNLEQLSNRGWRPLVVWQCETRSAEQLQDKLRTFLHRTDGLQRHG